MADPREDPVHPDPHTESGIRDTQVSPAPADAPPEQSAGGEETNPDGLEPKAGYSSQDPRSDT